MNKFLRASGLALSLLLTACGGGGGSEESNAPVTTLSGVVADGYIRGATVCLDRNANLLCDPGEPQAVSGDLGVYRLPNVPLAESTQYRVIAYVPAGAQDTDAPGGTVDLPYILTAPLGQHRFISPLTTLAVADRLSLPGYTPDQAKEQTANRLMTASDNLNRDYVAQRNDGMTREYRLARIMARFQAQYRKLWLSDPDYRVEDHAHFLIAYSRALHQLLPWFLTFEEGNAATVDLLFSDNADEWRLMVKSAIALQRRTPQAQDPLAFLSSGETWHQLLDLYPADCEPWQSRLGACPEGYPGGTLRMMAQRGALTGNRLQLERTATLRALANGQVQAGPPPLSEHWVLKDGDWRPLPPSSLIDPADTTPDQVVKTDISGLRVADLLTSLPLLNSPVLQNLPELASLNPETRFPAGSVLALYNSVTPREQYLIADLDPVSPGLNALVWSGFNTLDSLVQRYNAQDGQMLQAFVRTSRQDGNTTVTHRTFIRFAALGALAMQTLTYDSEGQVIATRNHEGAYWERKTVEGQDLLEVRYPPEFRFSSIRDGWTVMDGQVYAVVIQERGSRHEEAWFNEAALQGLITAMASTP